METKKIVIAAALIAVILVFSFVPFNNKKEIVIKASLYDVAKQINDLNNWKNWNTDLKNNGIKATGDFNSDQFATITPNYSYSLHHLNPLAVLLTRNDNGTATTSLIQITSVNDSTTNVIWSEKISVFELTKRNIIAHYSRQVNLNNLKKIMEDVNYRYGFLIRIVPVKDTLILTTETNTPDTSKNIVALLYQKLLSFIQLNKLAAEKKYFYKTQLNNNKVAVGIPVYKQLNNTDNIKFLQLPSNGRLVEGNYSGKISDKQSIYNAIANFMMSKHLKQVAQPLEQYNVADTIIQPNSNVNIKIYYPVF